MERKVNFQSVSWFWDLYNRGLLDMDPPYQRRSVWNQAYKDYFIDTVLLGYPSPAIFLYQEITPDGFSKYAVVDGKQRLSTLFEFAANRFPVSEKASRANLRGKYFNDLDPDVKREFWGYIFAVEYIPSTEEDIINNIFDRINRNMAKLSPQELRHARFDGVFITAAEEMTSWMLGVLPRNFPYIVEQSRKQMKDVELTAQLLLLIEEGVKSYSTVDLDKAFSDRDEAWEAKERVLDEFKRTIWAIKELVADEEFGLTRTRLRNQTDFYSLFGAVFELLEDSRFDPMDKDVKGRLAQFIHIVESEAHRDSVPHAVAYYEAARSASNDAGPRRRRIEILKGVLVNDTEAFGAVRPVI